jgi:hypothetical protein
VRLSLFSGLSPTPSYEDLEGANLRGLLLFSAA